MSTITVSRTVSAQEARRKFGELLDKAFYRRESFVVERAGEPKAVIVPMSEYNEMQRLREEARKRLFARIDQTQAQLAARDPDAFEAIIQEAIDATNQRP